MIRFRTEAFSGSRERNAAQVIAYEIFELGNTDILETLRENILKEFHYEISDFSEKDGVKFAELILKHIRKVTRQNIKYALWLADRKTVEELYYGESTNIESYQTGEIILSELGHDGTLYGYENMPIAI